MTDWVNTVSHWSKFKSRGWVSQNLGLGAWEFSNQPNVFGYINNPYWTDVATPTHNPCGYWYKNGGPPDSAERRAMIFSAGWNSYTGEALQGPTPPASSEYDYFTAIRNFPEHWKAISAGASHVLLIHEDGSLWGAGRNDDGQLGLGDYVNRKSLTLIATGDWRLISAGAAHSVAVDSDGAVWTVGDNGYTQLGRNKTAGVLPKSHTWEIAKTKAFNGPPTIIVPFVLGESNSYGLHSIAGGIRQVSANHHTTLVLAGEGNIVTSSGIVSRNDCGILFGAGSGPANGLGDIGPPAVGNSSMVFAMRGYTLSPYWNTNIGSYIAAGYDVGLVVSSKYGGAVIGFGHNNYHQLGGSVPLYVYSPMIVFPANYSNPVIMAKVGYQHSLLLTQDGEVWGSGDNSYGQLGVGDYVDRTDWTQAVDVGVKFKSISTSPFYGNQAGHHTLALAKDGTLWGCGSNLSGELGLGPVTNKVNVFTQLSTEQWDMIEAGGCTSFIRTPTAVDVVPNANQWYRNNQLVLYR